MSDDVNSPTGSDNNLSGITLYVAAVFLIVVMNAFAKVTADYHTPVEIVFYRGIIAMIILLGFIKIRGHKDIFRTKRLYTHLGRGLLGNLGVVLVFWAYSLMPMADVTALLFAAPLMVTVMSSVFLKEDVSMWRWLAVLTSFSGVLMILHPAGDNFSTYGSIVSLTAAFSTALVSIFLRDLGRTENALTTVFYFLAFGIGFSGIYMIFYGSWPKPDATWLLFGVGIAATGQLVLKTQAHKIAEASLLSPFNYTSIIWASLFGWIFWEEIPTAWVTGGAGIIIVSNILLARYERKYAQETKSV